MQIWASWPLIYLLVLSGLQSVDHDAARGRRAGRRRAGGRSCATSSSRYLRGRCRSALIIALLHIFNSFTLPFVHVRCTGPARCRGAAGPDVRGELPELPVRPERRDGGRLARAHPHPAARLPARGEAGHRRGRTATREAVGAPGCSRRAAASRDHHACCCSIVLGPGRSTCCSRRSTPTCRWRPATFWPKHSRFGNYVKIWSTVDLGQGLTNSVICRGFGRGRVRRRRGLDRVRAGAARVPRTADDPARHCSACRAIPGTLLLLPVFVLFATHRQHARRPRSSAPAGRCSSPT